MSQPVLECPAEWVNDCGCIKSHNYCWPRPNTDCCAGLQSDDPAQQAVIERTLRIAVSILHGLTGRQFGLCPVTVRPCRRSCSDGHSGYWSGAGWTPVLDGGVWYNQPCGRCGPSGCSCSELCEVDLPGPVADVLQVRLDGLVLNPAEYRVDNARKLVRTTFGPLVLDEWIDMGGGVAVATQSDIPANGVSWSGGAVVTNGQVSLPAQAGPFLLNFSLPGRMQQRVRFRLEPYAELTLPAGWTVEQIQTPGADSSVFQVSPTEVRGGQFGGWVVVTGTGQSPQFLLPSGPNGIGEERGGAAVEYVSYLDDHRGGCWPTCQNMAAPTTEPGTFEVTYRRGRPVPEAGLWAAGLLACELVKACTVGQSCNCELPANIKSVTREGVAIDFEQVNVAVIGNKGRTGIPEVDLWIQTVNPYGVTGRARAYSPDRPPMRTTTWPCHD